MSELVRYRVANGPDVVVEVDDDQAALLPAGRRPGEVAGEAAKTFEEAIAAIGPATEQIRVQLWKLAPQELSIEVGIKLTVEAGAIIAKAGGEANFKATLKWIQPRE